MTAPLCTRCRSEPAVQGSELGVRCLWPELAAEVRARAAELAAEGDRLGDAFMARTAAMEHVPGCQCVVCRPPVYPQRPNPDVTHREPRYGVEQRARRPDAYEPIDWYGGWPSYREPWQAEDSRRWYEAGDSERYEFRVVEFVPAVAHEECARCGTVGPVDVACRGYRPAESGIAIVDRAIFEGETRRTFEGLRAASEEHPLTGAPVRYFEPDPRGRNDAGARDVPSKPCCARSPVGGWCVLEDGHAGPHDRGRR